jgi:hypothetical protein
VQYAHCGQQRSLTNFNNRWGEGLEITTNIRRMMKRVVQSEAHLLSATTQARLAREASRGSVQIPVAAAERGARNVFATSVQGSAEKAPLISRKTGLPVYEPQSVMSSAHVFREYKQKGLPMPETKIVQTGTGERSLFLPIVLMFGVGSVAGSTFFESSSVVLPPVATTALMQEQRDAVLAPTTAALADAEVEAEKRLMEQQPLWLQRARA